jgi:hypothetical protein
LWTLTPSVFLRARVSARARTQDKPDADRALDDDPVHLFRCPSCGENDLEKGAAELACRACSARWAIDDGIYDFKTPRHA